MRLRLFLSVTWLSFLAVAASGRTLDVGPLVADVHEVWTPAAPGPILALDERVVPLVAGDEDATVPSVVAVATTAGRGRIVAVIDGFFNSNALGLFDNRRFALNTIGWLAQRPSRRLVITRGHREWFGPAESQALQEELRRQGYTTVLWEGAVSSIVLGNAAVVIIGTAWGSFTPAEMAALDGFVDTGGGLLLAGLGWSWEPYNPPYTLDDYPMNVLAEPYGFRWIDGGVFDPTNQHEGSAVFRTFGSEIRCATPPQAMDCIRTVTAAHSNGLPLFLKRYRTEQLDYLRSLLTLRAVTVGSPSLDAPRKQIDDFFAELIATYPQYFRKDARYNPATENILAWWREGMYRSLIDAVPLTADRRVEIATRLSLTGRYADLWNEFSVLLLDNTSLDERQKQFLYELHTLVPAGLHNLRSISVRDKLGEPPVPEIPLYGRDGSVNIFGGAVGAASENSFPPDVAPGMADVFCLVAVHELNHVVDANYIEHHSALRDRKRALVQAAGTDPRNYLRSMFAPGLFAAAPQEFFASISNEWFTDSAKTLELGLVRFRSGLRHPLEQALFMAEVYSLGGDRTYLYALDTQGNLYRGEATLGRAPQGNIVLLQMPEGRYEFEWDRSGNLTAANYTPRNARPR
ncbi:MAG: hypothetical protein MUC88_22410 [Planctomycetes bacterium]|nr:hypothetical protein [Planctomycetota bacterium]